MWWKRGSLRERKRERNMKERIWWWREECDEKERIKSEIKNVMRKKEIDEKEWVDKEKIWRE
jgi:hypothetical protein